MNHIYLKELRYYFYTPIAYIVIGLYLLAVSAMLWLVPGEWNIIDSGYSQVDGLFVLSPWLFMLLCPALTMHLYAGEKQVGTLNMLLIQPVSTWKIVLGKFLAAWTIVVLAQLPCILHYVLVYQLAEPVGNIDAGSFYGSYIGLIFLSASYSAIGAWTSSLTRNQIVAFITALLLCFVLTWGFDLVASLISNSGSQLLVENMGAHHHYSSISRGILDLRDTIWFFSITTIFILLTIYHISKKH